MRQTSEAEYSEFAQSVWPQLYRTAVMIVRDRQLAEDLVQIALVKTYIAWPRLRETGKAGAYTRRVMVNVAHDWFRKRSWTHEDSVNTTTDEGAPVGDHSAALVDRVALADLLKTLPLGQRSVLALRFLDDLSVQETADILNVTTGTVKSQTADALAALRSHALFVTEGSHHD
ncbi:SigE family RNA polymerase sigma factor [Aeromicrobium sp. Root344]|uniref:SigE family RNA polymerase sigma factor n=1 Tax=Aeromicrobium sp. Root344 TaxID=1736521 RepID=UPI000A482760|nr:SigE family RNA polymerase sigma factor [Aeromicrobium sp. Root344]